MSEKPRLCLRIGVTGHRPGEKLPPHTIPAITATSREILRSINRAVDHAASDLRHFFSAEPYKLVLLSALAEGADRIVASSAVAEGIPLEAILPFQRSIYAQDFQSVSSRQEFENLLARASSVSELEGARSAAPRAYEAAGLVMLANSDLIVAVWNQRDSSGIGGTAIVIEHAIAQRVPVILIDPANPNEARLIWNGDQRLPPRSARIENLSQDANAIGRMNEVVKTLLQPPLSRDAQQSLAAFYSERKGHRAARVFMGYAWLLRTFGVKPGAADYVVPEVSDIVARDWRKFLELRPDDHALAPAIQKYLIPAYAEADQLAIIYAQRYRGAFVSSYVIAALAGGLALCGLFIPLELKPLLVSCEIVCILIILGFWHFGHHGDWHRRWIEYRRLSEWLRMLRLVSLVGSPGVVGRPIAMGDGADWVSWYTRVLRRSLPAIHRVFDKDYLERVRTTFIQTELDIQIEYHERNGRRMKAMDHRMHRAGTFLFAFTGAVCSAALFASIVMNYELVAVSEHGTHLMMAIVTFLTACLPTVGAAINAIRGQADFETSSMRSKRTAEELRAVKTVVDSDPLELALLSDRIDYAIGVMSADVNEWQVLLRTRPLALPA